MPSPPVPVWGFSGHIDFFPPSCILIPRHERDFCPVLPKSRLSASLTFLPNTRVASVNTPGAASPQEPQCPIHPPAEPCLEGGRARVAPGRGLLAGPPRWGRGGADASPVRFSLRGGTSPTPFLREIAPKRGPKPSLSSHRPADAVRVAKRVGFVPFLPHRRARGAFPTRSWLPGGGRDTEGRALMAPGSPPC